MKMGGVVVEGGHAVEASPPLSIFPSPLLSQSVSIIRPHHHPSSPVSTAMVLLNKAALSSFDF